MRKYLGVFFALLIGLSFLYLISPKRQNRNQRVTEACGSDATSIEEYVKLSLEQDDPRILNYIISKGHLVPPSNESYDLKSPSLDPSMGQSSVVRKILRNMKNGFFVECGALDGETRSNTLDLELRYGWSGLLIEADPKNFALLENKHRKAWLARACLSIHPHPHQVTFLQDFNVGKIENELIDGKRSWMKRNEAIVQCFPLYSLLSAIGQGITTVDYFSLDVEGNELDVLMTIPWEKVRIRVLSVEYLHDKASRQDIAKYMHGKDYEVVTEVVNGMNLAHDLIFVHKSLHFSGKIPYIYS